MTTRKTPAPRLVDSWARGAAVTAHDKIGTLKARLEQLEGYAKRIERLLDDHLAGYV
jgi:hypothetical protein